MRHISEAAIRKASSTIKACWNEIGVCGDKSCPELEQHSHCRNCPAFSAAAATLLDRELPDQVMADWTSHFAGAKPLARSEAESAIIFRIGVEWFALSTLILDEVVGLRVMHSLPHRRSPLLLGLANVRGELVVCVSIARLLGKEAPIGPKGRLLVARHATGRLAFPVDDVQHTHRYHPQDLTPVPATVARSASSFTKGLLPWRDRLVGCLDEQLVLQALDRSLA